MGLKPSCSSRRACKPASVDCLMRTNDHYHLDFCDKFRYPPVIPQLIASFCDACKNAFGKSLISIVLTGSGARGELTWRTDREARLVMYSDLEFYVYVQRRPSPAVRKQLARAVDCLQAPLTARCPFFHIDYSIAPVSHRAGKMRKFINFESKATGKIIFGTDMLSRMPAIDSSNLNFRELNEILLHRLWSLLLYLPASFVKDFGDAPNFSYIISRNVLDITTWLLPYEHSQLIAGFKNRLDFMRANWERLGFKPFFTENDLEFLDACYTGKMHVSFTGSTRELYNKAVQLFITAARYMLHKNRCSASKSGFQNDLARHAGALFQAQGAKRQAEDAFMLIRSRACLNPVRALRWIRRNKKGLLVNFCFYMHRANIASQQHHTEGMKFLDNASECLDLLYPFATNTGSAPNEYAAHWLQLRKRFVDYRVGFERGYHSQMGYIYDVLA